MTCTLSVSPVEPPSDFGGGASSTGTPVVLGLGKTTATCIDKDGDGYGLGPGCANGPDADDNDPSVRTAQDVLAKYGSMRAFLNHHIQETLGNPNFAVRKIFYLDPEKGKVGRGKTDDENQSHRFYTDI